LIDSLVEARKFCFHNRAQTIMPKITIGDNTLPTCLQFDLLTSDGLRFAKVKIYDKITDLISREAQLMVGTRIRDVIGSVQGNNELQRKVR
jgi:hypothetical protein